jgi:hypothetical protein
MTISPISAISAGGLSQNVVTASNSNQLKQALQTLQSTLALGDLTSAQSAFQTLQTLFQNSATNTGSSLSNTSQLSTDMVALGSALSAGDVSTAQSAFATVLSDLKTTALPSQVNEASAASQSVQLVQELLGTVDSVGASSSGTPSGSTDLTNSILQNVYASQSGLNVYA